MSTHEEWLERARLSLEGLSVGDALGAFLELRRWTYNVPEMIKDRKVPEVEWHFTDDTNMALSIYAILRRHGKIDQDELANHFAKYYERGRGYGMGARRLLSAMQVGEGDWRELAPKMFGGGSYGNGGAMRVAPLGAYFADDIPAIIENAKLSAEITHAHPEGIAGAIAVAVAAGSAWTHREEKLTRREFIDKVLPHIPDSEVKSGVKQARDIQSTNIEHVVGMIGNGSGISAQDTVPFVMFCAGEWLNNYEEAIWQTMSGGGDVDTTCAMVGGIVATYTGYDAIPKKWIGHREKLPDWAFED